MITVGILISYVIALIILKIAPGSAGTVDWRLILGLGAVPALIGLALRTQMPESPRWLLRQGKYERVQAAMKEFGADVSLEDVEYTARPLREEDQRREQTKARNWTAGVRRALFVVCVFFIFQQITGINIPLYYGPHLLGPLFQNSHTLVDKTISGVEVTALMTVVNVAAIYSRSATSTRWAGASWPSAATSAWPCSRWSRRPGWNTSPEPPGSWS